MKITDDYVFFWDGIYSNWYPSPFTIGSYTFNCGEQYMMFMKAYLFLDTSSATKIMKTKDPKTQKALGKKVRNFDAKVWDEKCLDIMYHGLLAKFQQNESLKQQMLMDGKDRNFVEASPYDTIWGIGMGEGDALIDDPQNWKGKNYLGLVLDRVYKSIFVGQYL